MSTPDLCATDRQRVVNALLAMAETLNDGCHDESVCGERRALRASLANSYRVLARRFLPPGLVESVIEQVDAYKREREAK